VYRVVKIETIAAIKALTSALINAANTVTCPFERESMNDFMLSMFLSTASSARGRRYSSQRVQRFRLTRVVLPRIIVTGSAGISNSGRHAV
jgi:hypothetical protein